jgi:hypothetical protein
METASLTLHGDAADRVAEELMEETATVRALDQPGASTTSTGTGGTA